MTVLLLFEKPVNRKKRHPSKFLSLKMNICSLCRSHCKVNQRFVQCSSRCHKFCSVRCLLIAAAYWGCQGEHQCMPSADDSGLWERRSLTESDPACAVCHECGNDKEQTFRLLTNEILCVQCLCHTDQQCSNARRKQIVLLKEDESQSIFTSTKSFSAASNEVYASGLFR